jgi:hypothetical protein
LSTQSSDSALLTDAELRMLVIAILAVALVWLIKRWGPFPSQDPEKIARWRALPLRFKFACWFGVTPLAIIAVILGFWLTGFARLLGLLVLVIAWVSMLLLEGRVIAWYRENGHFRTYTRPSE